MSGNDAISQCPGCRVQLANPSDACACAPEESESFCTTCGGSGEVYEDRGWDESPDLVLARCSGCAGKGFLSQADQAKREKIQEELKASAARARAQFILDFHAALDRYEQAKVTLATQREEILARMRSYKR